MERVVITLCEAGDFLIITWGFMATEVSCVFKKHLQCYLLDLLGSRRA